MSEPEPAVDEVPKLPRGRGLKLSGPELLRVVLLAFVLVAVIMFTGPCSKSMSGFVMRFDNSKGSGSAVKKAPEHYEVIKPGMTDEEIKAAVERAKQQQSH